jgi:hypothetical protein
MGDVINFRANASIPGAITRSTPVIADRQMDSDNPVLAFGLPCKMVDGVIEAIEADDVAADFYGILSRLAPSTGGAADAGFLDGTPNATYHQAVLIKRYIAVLCAIGAPVIGQPVYMRVQADTGKVVGDLEATEDSAVAGGVITGTGTGLLTIAITDEELVKEGAYSIVLQETSATAEFFLFDPDGILIGKGNVATELVVAGLTMTISNAGTMTAGDSFAPVVTRANVKLPNVTWAVGGTDDNDVSEVFVA